MVYLKCNQSLHVKIENTFINLGKIALTIVTKKSLISLENILLFYLIRILSQDLRFRKSLEFITFMCDSVFTYIFIYICLCI